jgi:hypothetical protein
MSENKTGKYLKYAIGEIILVMIGILLALQVNNWNQQRIARIKEKAILSELHLEFIENKKQFEEVIDQHRQALKSCNNWIAKFPIDPKTVNLDSLPTRTDGMHRRYTFNPSQGIINSLISTSSFELISDRELRKLLVSWNDVLLDYQEGELDSKAFVIEELNPFMNKHFHHLDNYSDSRINTSILASLEFENLIYQRKEFLIDIVERRNEASNMEQTINRIIELSKVFE